MPSHPLVSRRHPDRGVLVRSCGDGAIVAVWFLHCVQVGKSDGGSDYAICDSTDDHSTNDNCSNVPPEC